MDRLTIPGAAKRLPFSESALRRMVVSGRVLGVKVGRDWLIDAEEVDKLIDQYPVEASEASCGGRSGLGVATKP